jgi:hypothetical protein
MSVPTAILFLMAFPAGLSSFVAPFWDFYGEAARGGLLTLELKID